MSVPGQNTAHPLSLRCAQSSQSCGMHCQPTRIATECFATSTKTWLCIKLGAQTGERHQGAPGCKREARCIYAAIPALMSKD